MALPELAEPGFVVGGQADRKTSPFSNAGAAKQDLPEPGASLRKTPHEDEDGSGEGFSSWPAFFGRGGGGVNLDGFINVL